MTEPSDPHGIDKEELCKACDANSACERTFGFSMCNTCKMFLFEYFKSKTIHNPCHRKRKCILNSSEIKECPCCLLRKCVDLKMDPYYETRQKLNNALRRSFPYHPCPTCTTNIEVNRDGYKISSDDGLEVVPECKVCGGSPMGNHYSALTCNGCRLFFHDQVMSKKAHDPCLKDQKCKITQKTRTKCQCCRLKKCLDVGMDPARVNSVEIKYELIDYCVPREWFDLLTCETCDSKKIKKINKAIQDLESFFMKVKENSAISSSKEVSERDTVQGQQFVNDNVNCLLFKSSDSVPKCCTTSIPDDTLKEKNLHDSRPNSSYPIESASFPTFASSQPAATVENRDHSSFENGLQVLSVETSFPTFPTFASSQPAATVENRDQSSFENGLQVLSVEKREASSSGSHLEVINDQRLNFSSTLSSSPSSDVSDDFGTNDLARLDTLDMTPFEKLISQNPNEES